MPEVTMEWLEKQAKQLVKKHWNINDIPTIILATRTDAITLERKLDWDNYSGFYCANIESIVMNNERNKDFTLRTVKRILLHELVHWRLHTTRQPYRDSDVEFAKELIRVGLGRRHNSDEQSQLAAKKAWKEKKEERFEIYEIVEGDVLATRLYHHRKNVEDFQKDLANTLILMSNERSLNKEEPYSHSIYPADVADKMKELYGYKSEPLATYGIILSANDGLKYNEVGDREDIAHLLSWKLDMDEEEIEERLMQDYSEPYAASEDD